MKFETQEEKGITLIALVITIIVLLILAGVTIATLTGDNGILNQAGKAKDKITEAESIERVQVEVAGSYGLDGTIDKPTLNENLRKNISGLTYNGKSISEDIEGEGRNRIEELPATVKVNGYDIQIDKSGEVNKIKTLEDYGLKVGDYVAYDEGTGYTYSSNDELGTGIDWGNNYHMAQGTIEIEDMNWRVLGVNSDGNIELISDRVTSSQLYIAREVGYLNLEKNLNDFCDTLYGNGNFALMSRSLNIDDCDRLSGMPSDEEKRQYYSSYGDLYQFKYSTSLGKIQYRKSIDEGGSWTDWKDTYMTRLYYPGKGCVLPRRF